MEKPRNNDEFLMSVYRAACKGQSNAIENLVMSFPHSADPECVLERLTPEAWSQLIRQERIKKRRQKRQVTRLITGVLVLLLCLVIGAVAFLNQKMIIDRVKGFFVPVPKPTYVPTFTSTPESTSTPTDTPTIMPSSTHTLVPSETPTLTPVPVSTNWMTDLGAIYPGLPVRSEGVWVWQENTAQLDPVREQNPGLWSEAKSLDPRAAEEPYLFITAGSARVSWTMDQPIPQDGVYAIYILDTLENSAGTRTFAVFVDEVATQPYRGLNTATFNTPPEQVADAWLSLGYYTLTAGKRLRVEAVLDATEAQDPFAVDRLMVVRLPAGESELLGGLPEARPLVSLLDERGAEFKIYHGGQGQFVLSKEGWQELAGEGQAWDGAFLSHPGGWASEIQVIWPSTGPVPAGVYEIQVWIPATGATAQASYWLLANDNPAVRYTDASIIQGDFAGEWASVGKWSVDSEAVLTVRMNVLRDAQGAIGVDAIAIVRVE